MAETDDEQTHPQSIKLPAAVEVFANLKNAKNFAIDIGISLTKIAYYSTVSYRKALYENAGLGNSGERAYKVLEGCRLHFVKFETRHFENCLDFVRANLVHAERFQGKSVKVTGGGAFKYTPLLQEKLGLLIDKEDEIACLIKGCNFLLKNIPFEAFQFKKNSNPEYKFQKAGPNIFPYMLVNIGSGVSILKVESEEQFERIGGTATGGGTFWGLGSLLTKAKGFDELLQLAERGDHRNVDMLVKDIYGGDYTSHGLPGDLIASSFGKAMSCNNNSGSQNFSEADIARSLLFTISNDIGQIASLYANKHNLNKVYFGGYFLRNHPLSMHTISYSIKYWSHGKVKPLFLRHEGYLGAIGAFLYGTEQSDKYSWLENYAGSSGFIDSISTKLGIEVDQLEIDQAENAVTFCPLLKDPSTYNPDTMDLVQDKEARDYWLQCFEESVDKFIARAVMSQPQSPTAQDRAVKLKEKYINRLHYLHVEPFAYGALTVRTLLDTIEHCMKEFDFPDPYLHVILCANSAPALNDVTYPELVVTLRNAAKICNVIKKAIKERRLIAMETAQAGPCLDLSRLNLDLCLAMVRNSVDLMVIEGMGRSLHTNLHAKMKCECLKLAVVKNRWLARRLGGDMYAVICKYEPLVRKDKSSDKYEAKLKNPQVKTTCDAACKEGSKNVCICTNDGGGNKTELKKKRLASKGSFDSDDNNDDDDDIEGGDSLSSSS
ncbi:4'-phosphopantetheine phosphatase isoform X3 [Neodiprion pinetum]|uniref:4'-phosphopantetheine phosphatase isoform X3 n=1 Tax=Neodiprion pinetum TaxID=441929 RepID=UPI001EDF83FF|nr:4'-phosphopantetheine phosphatase isoform X2 [Neodiprion pinetum]